MVGLAGGADWGGATTTSTVASRVARGGVGSEVGWGRTVATAVVTAIAGAATSTAAWRSASVVGTEALRASVARTGTWPTMASGPTTR